MDNTEIMTIEQLKEYKLLFDVHISHISNLRLMSLEDTQSVKDWNQGYKRLCWKRRPEGYRCSIYNDPSDMFYELNEYMNKFIVMQKEEKIIWAFNAKFKCAGSNILLTNKGKILYIEFNLHVSSCSINDFRLINYEIINHNFDIPSYAICALKMLIKNIEGQYTIYSTNERPKINDNDFNSIYKNINEYLEQLKQEQLKEELLLKQELLKKKIN